MTTAVLERASLVPVTVAGGAASIWPTRLRHDGRTVAFIGALRWQSEEAAVEILHEASRQARLMGSERLIGPVDGCIWNRHRAMVWSDGTEPFDEEDCYGLLVAERFHDAGYRPLDGWISARHGPVTRLDCRDRACDDGPERIGAPTPERLPGLLDELHRLAMDALVGTPLHQPIDRDTFRARILPWLRDGDMSRILLADDGFGLCGFLLLCPPSDRGGALVVRMMATARRVRGEGVASRLVAAAVRHARSLHAGTLITGLMHEASLSACWASARGTIIRRYAVFGVDTD